MRSATPARLAPSTRTMVVESRSTMSPSRPVSDAKSPTSSRADLSVSGRAATSLSMATGHPINPATSKLVRRSATSDPSRKFADADFRFGSLDRASEQDGRQEHHGDQEDPQLSRRGDVQIPVAVLVEGRLDVVDEEQFLCFGQVLFADEDVYVAHGIDAVDVPSQVGDDPFRPQAGCDHAGVKRRTNGGQPNHAGPLHTTNATCSGRYQQRYAPFARRYRYRCPDGSAHLRARERVRRHVHLAWAAPAQPRRSCALPVPPGRVLGSQQQRLP